MDTLNESFHHVKETWEKAAAAKMRAVKAEGSLYAAMHVHAHANSLSADIFREQMKQLQDELIASATGDIEKKAIRSTASTIISCIAKALEQGRPLVDATGKRKGKTRLENEAKAIAHGLDIETASIADNATLAAASKPAKQEKETSKPDAASFEAMLQAMVEGADDVQLKAIAASILHAHPALESAFYDVILEEAA